MENVGTIASRKEERIPAIKSIFFVRDASGNYYSNHYALSVNYSNCGVCVVTNRPIAKGEELIISSKHLWREEKSATVVWHRQMSDGLYQAGLSFC